MERILVFSDTHGKIKKAEEIIKQMPGVTGIIHLGDMLKDCVLLKKEFPDIPFYYVLGNNDFVSDVECEKLLEICGIKIFITHGHRYIRFFDNIDNLVYKGREESANIVLFGHTHFPYYEKYGSMIVANPGSVSHPRGSQASYGVIEIENDKYAYANIPIF